MIKKRIILILLALSTFCLSACGSTVVFERESTAPSDGDGWTVFVYMCGGNAEGAEDVLRDMMSVDYGSNVQFVVETGGRSSWDINGVYSDYTQRFVPQKGGLFLSSQSAAGGMATAPALSDFLNSGMKQYPADRYALIFWGAGGGALGGSGFDELAGGDSLTVPEISAALGGSGAELDLIAFDESCMGNIETASALSTFAKYMVASEDIIMPCGFDYSGFARYLSANPNVGAEDASKYLCDGYMNRCTKAGMNKSATMSVTDLSKMSELTLAFDGMAGMMLLATDNTDYLSSLMRKLEYTETLGGMSAYEGWSDMADLGNMSEAIEQDIGSTASRVSENLADAVIYNLAGKTKPYAKGMGVYYPFSGTAESIERYCDVFVSHNYLTFARKICIGASTVLGQGEEDYNSSPAYYDYLNSVGELGINCSSDGTAVSLEITGDMRIVKEISTDVYSENDGKTVYLGKHYSCVGSVPETLYTAEINEPTLSINGHNIMAIRAEKGYTADIYTAPVLLNGERANIRIAVQKDEATREITDCEILGVWGGLAESYGVDSRDFRKLKAFDRITPIYSDYSTGEDTEGKSFTVMPWGARASMSRIGGRAHTAFNVEDIYSCTHPSEQF